MLNLCWSEEIRFPIRLPDFIQNNYVEQDNNHQTTSIRICVYGKVCKKKRKKQRFSIFLGDFFSDGTKTASNTLKGSQKVQSFASNDEKFCFLCLKKALQANRVHTSLKV